MPLPAPTGAIRSPGLLWCEGPHDFAFLRRMLGFQGSSEAGVRVEMYEGKSMLPTYLTTLPLRPGYSDLRALAIVRDADEDASGAFDSVTDHLRRNGLVVPYRHGRLLGGECADGQTRSVGVFIAPDGIARGCLESLYLRAIANDPIVDCAQEFMRCIAPAVTHSLVAQLAKVQFHAWLAACPEPGIQPGQALDANYIDRNSPEFAPIIDFLTQLIAAATPPPP